MAKKKIDFGFTPSVYQEQVFDFVQHGTGNAVISALAGSGKTSTIVSCVKLIPKTQKCLFLAFNKSIVEELSLKLKSYTNCHVKTMHSLGYLMIRRNLGSDIEIDEYKYKTYIKKHIADLTSITDEKMSEGQIKDYIETIIKLIDFSRYNLAQSKSEIERIAIRYEIPVFHDECSVVKKALEWGKENYQSIDYTDMVWLPIELSLKPTGLQYDWIMNDEVQDYSEAYIQLMLKCFKKGTRFISVGDEKQSINKFAGASLTAFNQLCTYPNTQIFQLPISYRCPISVVEAARNFVPNMESRENAPQGEIKYDCHLSEIHDGDMVLARTKAPLLKLYVKFLRKNKQCYIKGSDIGLNLINMLERVEIDDLNSDLSKDGVFIRLYDNMFTERNKMVQSRKISKDDASLSSGIMEKYDSIGSLLTLAEKLKTKQQLIERIKKIFQEDSNGIVLSTVHKAKGLESNNVYILCYSTMPSSLAVSDWEKEQEENLIYVAITRAKQKLGFVSEKELPPCGSSQDPIHILNDLRAIEKQVCKVLGKEPLPEDDKIELTKVKLKNATQVDENSINLPQNTVVSQTNEDTEKPSEELLGMLSQYLDNGGDMSLIQQYLNK